MFKKIILLPIRFYQLSLSPLLGASKCRFNPTCSNYMIEAIESFGVLKGLFLGFKRILRCHPWGSFGHDPVPHKKLDKNE